MKQIMLSVCDDLFFGVQIDTLAKRQSVTVRYANTREAALEQARLQPQGILVDLANRRLDTVALIAELKRDPATKHIPVFAFVPHVDVEKKAQALAAGADRVVARSAFQLELPKFLERHAGALQPEPQKDLDAGGA